MRTSEIIGLELLGAACSEERMEQVRVLSFGSLERRVLWGGQNGIFAFVQARQRVDEYGGEMLHYTSGRKVKSGYCVT